MTQDHFLEVQSDDWSDSDDENPKTTDPLQRIQILERKLAQVKHEFADYRNLISERVNISSLLDASTDAEPSQSVPSLRDDDSHYFKSYGENGSVYLFPAE